MKKLIFFLSVCFLPTVLQAQWQWATVGNNQGDGWCTDIATDASNNVYVTGTFNTVLSIDNLTLVSKGRTDIFVVKYDASGQLQWAKSAGGASEEQSGGITVDNSGNVYVCSSFSDGALYGNQSFSSKGDLDINLTKFDNAGNQLWSKSWGTKFDDYYSKLTVSTSNNLYLTGAFSSDGADPPDSASLRFDTVTVKSVGGADVFLVKMDTSGMVKWAKSGGSRFSDLPNDIAVDNNENIFITGCFSQPSIVFDTITMVASGWFSNMFIVKYDSSGSARWARGAGSDFGVIGVGVACDDSGNVYTTGGTVTGTYMNFGSVTLHGSKSYFAKYGKAGQLQWVKDVAGTAELHSHGIVINSSNELFVAGYFNYRAVFGSDTILSHGSDDIVIAKYDNNGNSIWAANPGSKGQDGSYAIVLDNNEDILIAGYIGNQVAEFGNYTFNGSDAWDMCVAKLSKATTGITSLANPANTVSIYPNPASQEFSVSNPQGSYTDLKLYDATGRLLLSQSLNKGNTIVDIRHINVGIYYITFTANDENITPCYSKLLVQ